VCCETREVRWQLLRTLGTCSPGRWPGTMRSSLPTSRADGRTRTGDPFITSVRRARDVGGVAGMDRHKVPAKRLLVGDRGGRRPLPHGRVGVPVTYLPPKMSPHRSRCSSRGASMATRRERLRRSSTTPSQAHGWCSRAGGTSSAARAPRRSRTRLPERKPETGPAPQSIPFASRVRCLVALGAYRRRTALGPGLLAAGPASHHTLLLIGSVRAGISARVSNATQQLRVLHLDRSSGLANQAGASARPRSTPGPSSSDAVTCFPLRVS
jgi:hypothetical protein